MEKILVLGAGVAGIASAYHLQNFNIGAIVYEQNSTWGGLCDSFNIDGFTFDTFVHLAFSNDELVNSIFEKNIDIIRHINCPSNYYKGKYLKHPVQDNLFNLDIDDKISIIEDFVKKDENKIINNYEDWLFVQYGIYFAEEFPMRYTRKYWTLDANNLETKWVSVRMHKPTLGEVLKGAMTEDTPNYSYAPKLKYPKYGGFKSFLNNMASKIKIVNDKKVKEINLDSKLIYFEDDTKVNYSKLISTIPLTEICKCIKNIPSEIIEASNNLDYTSGVLISLGLNKPDIPQRLMFYIYDENIFPARIYSPSVKSPNNVPTGCSSLQAEIYFSKYKPLPNSLKEILELSINQMINMNLFTRDDIVVKDIRVVKYANVIFTPKIYESRSKIQRYLRNHGIIPAGRFGEWDYLWSDQAFNSGKKAAEEIINLK